MYDPYRILGVDQSASESAVRNAYLQKVKQHHPDLFQEPRQRLLAEERLKEINLAYAQLTRQARHIREYRGTYPYRGVHRGAYYAANRVAYRKSRKNSGLFFRIIKTLLFITAFYIFISTLKYWL